MTQYTKKINRLKKTKISKRGKKIGGGLCSSKPSETQGEVNTIVSHLTNLRSLLENNENSSDSNSVNTNDLEAELKRIIGTPSNNNQSNKPTANQAETNNICKKLNMTTEEYNKLSEELLQLEMDSESLLLSESDSASLSSS